MHIHLVLIPVGLQQMSRLIICLRISWSQAPKHVDVIVFSNMKTCINELTIDYELIYSTKYVLFFIHNIIDLIAK